MYDVIVCFCVSQDELDEKTKNATTLVENYKVVWILSMILLTINICLISEVIRVTWQNKIIFLFKNSKLESLSTLDSILISIFY